MKTRVFIYRFRLNNAVNPLNKNIIMLFSAFKGFHELESPRNGKPYCRSCYIDLTCSKCAGCKKAITDKAVKALDADWHVDCFVCKVIYILVKLTNIGINSILHLKFI